MQVYVVIGMMAGCFQEIGVYAVEEQARAEYSKIKNSYGIVEGHEEESENAVEFMERRVIGDYIFEALKELVELIGDEDLEDNGELSGAAICDMARTAVARGSTS